MTKQCASSCAELPDAGQAREHARRFVAMQRRLLVKADRQVAVAADLAARTISKWPGQFIAFSAICLAFAIR